MQGGELLFRITLHLDDQVERGVSRHVDLSFTGLAARLSGTPVSVTFVMLSLAEPETLEFDQVVGVTGVNLGRRPVVAFSTGDVEVVVAYGSPSNTLKGV